MLDLLDKLKNQAIAMGNY